ncbi:MAG: shikimate kinase [Wenzhouxiangella sp.]|nr:shikimate kinase [Wenzhouxiangella sp.]
MDNVILIGPMGSGKTTVGKALAPRLGLEFIDLDQQIEQRCGVEVSLIFEIEGEQGFRAREQAMLAELSTRQGMLLATGGGSVLDPANRQMLRSAGLVVWLQTGVDQQLRRLARDQRRPLLRAPDRRERLEKLAAERDPLYRACAHRVVRSSDVSPARMALRAEKEIRQALREVIST